MPRASLPRGTIEQRQETRLHSAESRAEEQGNKEERMDVLEAIASKRAVRHFTDQPITDEDLRAILDAGRRAQSSKNTQPWTFIAIRDRQTLRRLSECGAYAGHLAGAAVGVALLSAGPTGFDLGQAAAYLQLAAWELGVGTCIATIYEPERAREILGVPETYAFDIALSLGYPDPAVARAAAPPGQGRKSFDDVVRFERW
jgi:nitroreductase